MACRVWSAACSTGEEPWTLAMVLAEVAAQRSRFRFQVLATDLSTEVLAEAKAATYEEARVEPVPMPLRRKYLLRRKDRSGSGAHRPELRAAGTLRAASTSSSTTSSADGPLEIIFCRNVFIYFERPVQRDILHRFARALVPGGYLFLGHSESINGIDVPLTQVAPTVYRKAGWTK